METIKKYKLILVLITLIIVIGVFGYYIKGLMNFSTENPNFFQHLSITPTPTPDSFIHAEKLNLPSSYMGYTFTKVTQGKNVLGKLALYYNNNGIDLKGAEWVVEKNNLSDKEYMASIKDFETLINTQLQKFGWVTEITVDGHKFAVLSAGGSTGNVYGYLKIIDRKVQVVLLQIKKDKIQCPCSLEFRIFISNVSELSIILK